MTQYNIFAMKGLDMADKKTQNPKKTSVGKMVDAIMRGDNLKANDMLETIIRQKTKKRLADVLSQKC